MEFSGLAIISLFSNHDNATPVSFSKILQDPSCFQKNKQVYCHQPNYGELPAS